MSLLLSDTEQPSAWEGRGKTRVMTSFACGGIRNSRHTNIICLGVYVRQPLGGSQGSPLPGAQAFHVSVGWAY